MRKRTGNQTMPYQSSPLKTGGELSSPRMINEDFPGVEHPSFDGKGNCSQVATELPSTESDHDKTIYPWRELVTGPLEPINFLVDKVIPAESVVVVGGDSGVGKSWFAQHMAQCVGAGEPVLGHFDAKQGAVVYVDEESSPYLLKRRIQKLAAGLPVPDDIPVSFLVNRGVRIDKGHSLKELMDILQKVKPRLIIFDSYIRIHGANENDSREMSEVHARLRAIQKRLGCAIVVTHHARKRSMFNQAGEMLRGSTDIRAFADGHLFMRKTRDKTRKLIEHEKSRWCEPLDPFEIEIVDNEAETATFVRYVRKAEAPKAPKEIAKELIPEILREKGRLPRQAIIERCKGEAGSKAVGEALKELRTKLVVDFDVGPRGQHIYRLLETSEEKLAALWGT